MKKELVKNWMTREVIAIVKDTSVAEAQRLMADHQIRRLPVLDEDRLLGLVTLGDVREAVPSGATSLSIWEVNYILSQLTVEKIMSHNPITISPFSTISEAAWSMLEYKVSGLPVIDRSERLVGIITESDIFRLVVHAWGRDTFDDTFDQLVQKRRESAE